MDIILEQFITLTPEDLNKHIIHECILNKEYKKLNVIFEYSPKYLEDEEKQREIIFSTIDKYSIGKENEEAKNNWKQYKGIKNNITVSVDDENGFRGMAHRRDQNQNHIISENESSPGFTIGKIPAGLFKVTVSIHALVTEQCNYKVAVYDMEGKND